MSTNDLEHLKIIECGTKNIFIISQYTNSNGEKNRKQIVKSNLNLRGYKTAEDIKIMHNSQCNFLSDQIIKILISD